MADGELQHDIRLSSMETCLPRVSKAGFGRRDLACLGSGLGVRVASWGCGVGFGMKGSG